MIEYNFLNLPFSSPFISESEKIYAFYKKNGTDYTTKVYYSDGDSISSDECTNFEHLISFLNYDITPLRGFLNTLITMIDNHFSNESESINMEKFVTIINNSCKEFSQLHPCLGRYSKYYISYILISSCSTCFLSKTEYELYSAILYILQLVFMDSDNNTESPVYNEYSSDNSIEKFDISERIFKERKKVKKEFTCLFESYYLKEKTESSLNELADNIINIYKKYFPMPNTIFKTGEGIKIPNDAKVKTIIKDSCIYFFTAIQSGDYKKFIDDIKYIYYHSLSYNSASSKGENTYNAFIKGIHKVLDNFSQNHNSENTSDKLADDIYNLCYKFFGIPEVIYKPFKKEHDPVIGNFKDSIKECCKNFFDSKPQYCNYDELINSIKDKYKEIIAPHTKSFIETIQLSMSIPLFPEQPCSILRQLHYFLSLNFDFYCHIPSTADWENWNSKDISVDNINGSYDDPLYFLEQFRNDIIIRMPDSNFSYTKNEWYIYMDYLYKKYGCCYRLPQISPSFQKNIFCNSQQNTDSSTHTEKSAFFSPIYESLFTDFLNRPIGVINKAIDGELFFKNNNTAYIIDSFSQYILSDLDSLFAFKKRLYLHCDGNISLSPKYKDSPQNEYEALYKNKLRSLRHLANTSKDPFSTSILLEEEYLHNLIYRYALYNKFSLDYYKKILDMPEYQHGKLLLLYIEP